MSSASFTYGSAQCNMLHCLHYWSLRLARCLLFFVVDSVCLSVDVSRPFKSILLFCFSVESSHFWPSVLHEPLFKTLFFDYGFRPSNAQNLLPNICTKSPISRLVWQIHRRCLGLPGGFRRCPIKWNYAKCCGADPYCYGTKFGLGAEIQAPTGLFIHLLSLLRKNKIRLERSRWWLGNWEHVC